MEQSCGYPFEGFVKKYICTRRNKACAYGFGIFSFISYLFFVTNDLNNYDNIATLTRGFGTGISSGRWFLQILGDWMTSLNLDFNLPFYNVLIALLFLLCAALFVIRILHIEDPLLCFGIGAITAAFPTVASTMFFSYTVHYYFFALLLGTVGVWLALQNKWYRLFSALLFALSLGIYQAYLPFIAMLFVLALIRETLDDSTSWQGVLKDSFICLALMGLGYLLYMGLSRYFIRVYETAFNDYQGISSMGKLELSALPQMIKDVYKHYLRLYRLDYHAVSATSTIQFCVSISFLAVAACLVLDWKKRTLLKNLELGVLLFLLPAAADSMLIMVPDGFVYTLMVMGLIAVFYAPALMAQHLKFKFKKAVILLVCATTLLAAGNYAYQTNVNYRALYFQNKKVENYLSILLTQVRSTEGYTEDMELVFVGSNIQDNTLHDDWTEVTFQYGGNGGSAMDALNAYSRPDFIYQFFGYPCHYATDEELAAYASQLEGMATYPNSGSIKIIDDLVFVNCG